MAVMDERGRLFGRINLIDAGVALLLLLIVLGTFVGYRVYRLPAALVVTTVEPRTQQAGPGMKLQLRGHDLLPFLHVYIQKTGASRAASASIRPIDRPTNYLLTTSTVARFLVESPSVAQVLLPDTLEPGTYDLAFYSETQAVAVFEAAFVVTPPPPPPPPPPSAPRAVMRITGAFTGLDRGDVGRISSGMKLPSNEPVKWADVVTVQPPRPSLARVQVGPDYLRAPVEGKLQVPAVLRVHCVLGGVQCVAGGVNLQAGNTLAVQVGAGPMNFLIDEVVVDADEISRTTEVTVRFVAQVETARLVQVGQVDRPRVPLTVPRPVIVRPLGGAVITSIGERQEMASTASLGLSDLGFSSVQIPERVTVFEATLRVPLTREIGAWYYKGQPVKAGAALSFETENYLIRGWVLRVALER
jgi:hypothetical protein